MTHFFGALRESFRDRARDDFCEHLCQLGVPARLAPRGCPEEDAIGQRSLGLVWISEGPIRWVNVRKGAFRLGNESYDYLTDYGVPDPRLRPGLASGLDIECVTAGGGWSFRSWSHSAPTKLEWRGTDRGLGLLRRLNRDASLTTPILSREFAKDRLTISAHEGHGFWTIVVPGGPADWVALIQADLPSLDQWHCYQAIAQHLLDTSLKA